MNPAAEGFDVKLGALSQKLGRRAPVAEQIAECIRNMIVAGDLKPGERIVESRIARDIGVGQPTVREALVALEHQGLVVRKVNQGCVVTSLTRTEICQLIRVRADLETLAVELAVETASDAEIAALLKVTERMKDAAAAGDPQRFFKHDLMFHQALWNLSHNSFLPRLLEQALAPLLAFLFIRNLRRNPGIDMMESALAHVDMAQAILTRDKAEARRVTQEKLMMFADQHLALYE
ncbi:MAG: GntR family transcriptional regulator [Candidatus Sulfopaludibacter sp.]|nr:GntR family transcriptional regulator [Candidatus Sulfopaludibacter sp.]